MKLLGVLVLCLPTAAMGAPTPTITPTPTYEINVASARFDTGGVDIEYRYISPARQVKAWDTIRVMRQSKETNFALYKRATDVMVAAVTAREAEFKARVGTVSRPTHTRTATP